MDGVENNLKVKKKKRSSTARHTTTTKARNRPPGRPLCGSFSQAFMRLVLSLWWIALSRTSFACLMPRLCCANAMCPSKSNKSAKPFTDNVRVMQWRASNHLRGEFPLRPECNHICLSFYLKYSYIPKLLVGDSDEQAKAQVYQEWLARTTLVA